MVGESAIDLLCAELQSRGNADWVVAAREALKADAMQYVAEAASASVTAAGELVQIFRRRLTHCQDRGVFAVGIEELLSALSAVDGSTPIVVEPFLSPTRAVTAFYRTDMRLLVCVTVARMPSDPGAKNLVFAMGK